ncbi:MAG: phosphotransferase [Phycisphaerales bacterium]|nr:phosphotransferase [Phycisphaerales bacterium]
MNLSDSPDLLDIENERMLRDYLRAGGHLSASDSVSVRVLAGGVSNKTVLMEWPDGHGWVLKQALAKLRVAVDWFSDPARIEREAMGLRWLEKIAPPGTITPLVFEDPAHHLLAMEAVPRPHENYKTLLLSGQIDESHAKQFGQLLAAIHRGGWERQSQLATIFDDRSFYQSLRLEPYYQYTAQQVPDAADFLTPLIQSTLDRRITIVHGDYSPKNVLVRDGRLILLDHEVIHFGDPAFDLGFAMTHLLSKAHHLPQFRPALLNAAGCFWNSYLNTLGDVPFITDLPSHAARQTLGCLLARVAGRSPLEYLTGDQRLRQRHRVVELMKNPPANPPELFNRFIQDL